MVSIDSSCWVQMLCAARWRAVLATFLKFRIVADPPPRPRGGGTLPLPGCSTILGMPMLNSGSWTGAVKGDGWM